MLKELPHIAVNKVGEKANIQMPIQKYSTEARTVSGFATLDNIDEQGDIITAEAAMKAFKKFRGNLREQHQPKAVGKILNFSQEVYYDTATEKFYNGIYVSAYISKGAEDTWQKVLDGTLSAFSVGGIVKEAEPLTNEESGETIHIINDMELFELSLVDNPANALANVVSIQKLKDGSIKLSGIAAETKLENIFWCEDCSIASTEEGVEKNCRSCETPMDNIGWIADNDNAAVAVEKALHKHKGSQVEKPVENPTGPKLAGADTKSEGVTTMETEMISAETEVVEESTEASANAEVEAAVDETSEPETVESEATQEKEITEDKTEEAPSAEVKVDIDAIASRVLSDIKDYLTEQAKADTSAAEKKSVDSDTTEVDKMETVMKSVADKIDALSETISSVERRIESLENGGAVRKSAEADSAAEAPTVKKSLWDGHFLGVSHISRD